MSHCINQVGQINFYFSTHFLVTKNVLKTSLKEQDCPLRSLNHLNHHAMENMLKGKLSIIFQLHLPKDYWKCIWIFSRLYYCTHRQTEALHFLSSPRWNGGFTNETAICEELTDLSECEKETACKEMASGMWYTIASVSWIHG